MERSIAVIILNYNTEKETSDCIKSIIRQDIDKRKVHTIIVDNQSTDGSGAILRNKWCDNNNQWGGISNIYYVGCSRNLGFANGMNEGILFARNSLGIENVLLLNSDTILQGENFLSMLLDEIEPDIGVVGPQIVNWQKDVSYKTRMHLDSYSSILQQTIKRRAFLFVLKYDVLYRLWRRLKPQGKQYNTIIAKESQDNMIWGHEVSDSIWIPGCGFMLTEYYFKKYPILWPYTFLYCEEPIITLLCRKAGLRLKHLEEPRLMHMEGIASKRSFNCDRNKLQAWADSCTQFCRVYRYGYQKCKKRMDTYLIKRNMDA